jgi:hypothetical protein
MKTLLFILFTFLPFTLSAQFTVKAYKTTDQHSRKAIRIEIKNTGNKDVEIRNRNSILSNNGTILHFSTSKKQENSAFFSFQPNPIEDRKFIVIKKGETEKVDVPLNEIANYISIDKNIYVLGYIEYFLSDDNKLQVKDIAIEVK